MKLPEIDQEYLLSIWLESEPSEVNPNKSRGEQKMWLTFSDIDNGIELFTFPRRTMTRKTPYSRYEEVNGVGYRWKVGGEWIGSGYQTTFDDLSCFVNADYQKFIKG